MSEAYLAGLRKLTRSRLKWIKLRCHEKNIPYDINTQYLYDLLLTSGTHCPVCNVLYREETNHKRERTVDRVVHWQGYSKGNLQIMCKKCNGKKGQDVVFYNREVA